MLLLSGLAMPAGAQVSAAVDAAEAWLLSQQSGDGSFGGVAELRPRDTAITVLALAGRDGSSAGIANAATYLGGVPEANVDFRSQRALALSASGNSPSSLLTSIGDFRNGGGMGAFVGYQSSLLDTAFAIQALTLEEGNYLLDIVNLLDYVQANQAGDGGWGFSVGAPSEAYFSGETLHALADLDQLAIGQAVLDGVNNYLLALQQPDGSFGSVLDTAVAYRGLLGAGLGAEDLPSGSPVPFLLAAQAADGSWQGDVFTTAQVVRVLREQKANLVPQGLALTPPSALPGTLVELMVTVRNIGPRDAEASHLAVRRDTADGPLLHELEVVALAAGESVDLQVAIDTADFTGGIDLFAVVDSQDEVDETSEGDNEDLARLTLRGGADLALFSADLVLDPTQPRPDEDFQLLINARNLGESEVDTFDWRVRRLVAGVPTDVLASGSTGPIAPGGALLIPATLSLSEGEHAVEVELDPDGTVDEELEDNNLASLDFFVVDPAQPDLAVLDPDVILTPAEPLVGDSVDVSVTVRNLGERPADSELVIYQNDPSDGGIELGRYPLALEGGTDTTIAATFVTAAVAHSFTFVVDPDGLILETDETNNRLQRFFRELPDLAIGFDNIELLPAAPLDGDPVIVAVTVRNAGTLDATDVLVELWDGEPSAGGVLIGNHTFDTIPAGGNQHTDFDWTATGGGHRLVAVSDPAELITELSESNNRGTRAVAVPRGSGPDLEVTAVDLTFLTQSPVTLELDGTIDVTLSNTGDADVTDTFQLRLFADLDGDRLFGGADVLLASELVSGGLAAAANTTVSVAVDATAPFHHALAWAEVDATDVVAERREDNNLRTLFADCEIPPPATSLEPIEEWYLPGINVETVPLVAQLTDDNGDGRIDSRDVADIIMHGSDANGNGIFAVSGLDGSEVWTFRASSANPVANHLSQAALADIDGDGMVEILGHQTNGRFILLEHDGTLKWVSDKVAGVGNRHMGGPAIGDLDGDGVPEIAQGRSVLDANGNLIAVGTGNLGNNRNRYGPFGVVFVPGATSYTQGIIADVDLDGRNELVAGDTLYRLEGGSLEIVWNKTVPDRLMDDGFTAVGNLDGDPEAEIVYVSSGQIMVLNHDGSTRAGRRVMVPFSPFQMPTFWGGNPTLADLDGDGVSEILVVTATHVIAYNGGLGQRWRRALSDDFGGFTGITAFDLDGDGAAEVLYNDETTFYILAGSNGAVLHTLPNRSFTAMEHASVADVDGDGRAEIILPSNRDRVGNTSTQGLHVLGNPSWQGARPMWNQYSYHVTNVGLDGTVPSPQTPAWQIYPGFRANIGAPAPVASLPNLTVSLPRVGMATADGVPVTVRVGNGGREPVPAGLVVELFDGVPGTTPAVGTATTQTGLRPGAWLDLQIQWQGAASGGITAWAAIDQADSVAECDENDNAFSFLLEATVLPDLAVAAGGVTATSPVPAGAVVPVTVVIENLGIAGAPANVLRLFGGEPASSPPVAEVVIEPLAAGDSRSMEIAWETIGQTPGIYTLHAVLDADGEVAEVDETNNRGLVQIELVAPALPDLALTGFTADAASVIAGQSVRLTAQVINRGATLEGGFEVSFLVNRSEVGRASSPAILDAGASRTIEFDLDTSALAGVLEIGVLLDPSGAVPEADETNNEAILTLTVDASLLGLRITTDALSYNAGEDVAIVVTGSNGDLANVAGELELLIVDSVGTVVAEVFRGAVDLPPGDTDLPYSWNTGSTFAGTYSVRGTLLVDGASGAQASSLISIAGQVEASASLFADRDVYTPLQTAVFSGAVRNLGGNQPLSNLIARVAVTGPGAGGSEVFATELPIVQLLPGATRPLTVAWDIGNAAGGEYLASLELRTSGLMIAYAETTVAVEDSASTGSGLDGLMVVSPDVVGAGAPLLAATEVTNSGNADMADLVLRVDMLRLVDGELVASFTRPQPLLVGETRHVVFGLPTAGLAEEDYLVTLTGILPSAERRLDGQAVTVTRGLSISDVSLLEGDAGQQDANFVVTLSSASDAPISVNYATADGTATAGQDYLAAAGTINFAVGEVTQTVTVSVLGDLVAEPSETFLVTLSDLNGVAAGDLQGLGTLIDEEGCVGPNLIANPGAEDADFADWTQIDVTEGNGWRQRFADPVPLAGVAYFGYSGMNPAVELQQEFDLAAYGGRIDASLQSFAFAGFVRSGAMAPADSTQVLIEYLDATGAVLDTYDSGALTSAGTWQAVSEVRVAPVGTRSALLRLIATELDASGQSALEAYFDQLEFRSLGVPVLVAGDTSFFEGNAGTVAARLDLSLSCAAGISLDIGYTTSDVPDVPDDGVGSAMAGVDYQAAVGSVSIQAGDTAGAIDLELLGDILDEPDELFQLDLTSTLDVVLLRSTLDMTITDDDGPVTLDITDVSVAEGEPGNGGVATLTLTLSAVSGRPAQVQWATANGSALAGTDYVAASGTASFPPGVIEQTLQLQLVGDGVYEPEESFEVRLSSPVNVSPRRGQATVTVVDDDPVAVAVADAPRVDEGDSGTTDAIFTVSLSVPSVLPVSIDYSTQDAASGDPASAGIDYQVVAGTLVFSPGTTSLTVAVPVIGDLEREPQEVFLLRLSNPSIGSLADPEAVGLIFDDDGILISIADRVITEGPSNLSFRADSVVRASSQFNSSYPPSRAVDDNVNTSWFSARDDAANQGGSPWLEVEFAADATVTQIRIFGNRELANSNDIFAGIFQLFDEAGNVLYDSGEVQLPAPVRDLVFDVPPTGGVRRARFTSTDDQSREPGLSEFHVMGTELLALTVPVTLSKAATFPVSVDYQTVDGSALAGSDYIATSGTLDFAPGVIQLDVPLEVIGDTFGEPVESFFVSLDNPVESQVLDGEGEITILDTEVWRTNGDGSITEAPLGCVRLTPDSSNRRGSAWRLERIDLTENFDKTFRVYLGTRDSNGSDGIVFVLQNSGLNALGGHGGALGYNPIAPSFGIEIDTYDNGGYDPTEDHIAVSFNGQYWAPQGTAVQASATAANIEDGQEHEMRVIWNAEAQQADVLFDGVHRTFFDHDIITNIFGGTEEVFYGFTGGNGFVNEQYFCEQRLCAEGSTPQVSVGNGYLLEGDLVDGGASSAVMSIPVTLSCPASETVTVDYASREGTARAGEDYESVSGSLTFPAGETSAWINVTIHADDLPEPDETFIIDLTNLQGAATASTLWYASGVGNILTDDVVWHINGSAREDIPVSCIRLTPDNGTNAGSAWRSQKINLTQHFDMTFDVYVGTRDGNGADGLVFALQNQSSTRVGGAGAGMGWNGITPGVGIEVDTYDNGGYDPTADHLAVNINGSITNGQSTAVQASPTAANIEDGQRRPMRIVWNADTKTLDVHFEDDERLIYQRDIVAEVFGGTEEVWWGFTGGNAARNEHYFCPTLECFGHDPNPRISVGDTQVNEGDGSGVAAQFSVTLHCPSLVPVTVRYTAVSDTALVGEDFAVTTGTLTFQPGETSKTVAVPIIGDDLPEETETFFLQLSQATGGQVRYAQGVGTILTDDIGLTFVQTELPEGDSHTYSYLLVAELSAPAPTALSVDYSTVDGTAIAGEDYTATSGTLSIAAGARTASIRLDVLGDAVLEDDEDLFLNILGSSDGVLNGQNLRIIVRDDDDCPSPNMLLNGGGEEAVVDGVLPGWTEFLGTDWKQRTRSPAPFDGIAYIQTGVVVDGELRQDVDISGFANRVDLGLMTFEFLGAVRSYNQGNPDTTRVLVEYLDAAGEVLEFYDSGIHANRSWWQAVGDLRIAPIGSRTIRVRLISHRNTGSNNDGYYDGMILRAMKLPSIFADDAAVQEGESGIRLLPFTVRLSCAAEVPVVVDYLTSDGDATAGSDYQAVSGQLTFAPGEVTHMVEVPVFGDTLSEDNEVFYLNLLNPLNGGVANSRATGTILQDEVLLTPTGVAVTEGNSGTTAADFTLTLSAPSTLPILVDYVTAGGSATSSADATEGIDYVAASGTLTFMPGETVKVITVDVLGDLEVEPDETFRINLSNPINVTLADTRGYADILDDDVEVSIGDVNINEGDVGNVTAVFEVILSKSTGNVISVEWHTEDGLALAGEDYESDAGTVVFQPGEIRKEIRIDIIGDTEIENSETFSVYLGAMVNALPADDEAIGLIIDDDDCPGPNLLVNGGAEEVEGSELLGWTEVVGTSWQRYAGSSNRRPYQGSFMFWGRSSSNVELRQDVDLSPFAYFIDAGLQRFAFQGFVSTHRNDDDPARIVVDYLDAAGVVLDTFDSGEIVDIIGWQQVADQRLAPVGTRSAVVRLISRIVGTNGDANGYFDSLSLRSVGTPVMSVEDLEFPEGDTASVFADFQIQLTCASPKVMHLDYQTVDGTATVADNDYIPAQGTLDFAIGEEQQTLSIEVPGDFKNELIERFTVEFSNEVEMVVLKRVAEAAIRDADPGAAPVPGVYAIYTLDHEFDTGSLVSVHHDTPLNDQLQLVENGSTFPFIWIALSNRGTIVKIDVATGDILGEYSTSPDNRGSNPSRTTVALDGSVWVGNRSGRSVTHVGLPELNQCIDKNGNGFIETSVAYGDILPWPNASGVDSNGGVETAVDECVLHHVPTTASGTRHLSVTVDNNIWVSGTSGRQFDLIEGSTGAVLRTETGFSCGGYGGLIDGNGIIWSITSGGSVLRWDPNVVPATAESKRCLGGMSPYGIGIDSEGWVWITQFSGNRIRRVSPDGNTILGPFGHGDSGAQGVAVDANDEVWTSTNLHTRVPRIGHVNKEGTFIGNVTDVCRGSTGVAIDANGKVWAACFSDGQAARIDPAAGPIGADGVTPIGAVDLVVDFPAGPNGLPRAEPYNYSDMTGFVALRSTAPQGSFSVIQDSGIDGAEWGNVSWNTEPEAFIPEGGSIIVEARAADTVPGLGGIPWTEVDNAVSFEIYGRFMQVRVTLRPAADGTSPVLSDLRIGVIDDALVTLGDAEVVEGDAGDGQQLVFPITFAQPTVLNTTFTYTTVDGSAVAGNDYVAVVGSVTIPAGQTTGTITVDVVGDDFQEASESLTVVLSNPSNAIFVDGEALGTINDDDVPQLTATKVDVLVDDANGNSQANPGDGLRYDLLVSNPGTGIAEAATLQDVLPLHTTLVPGSVVTSVGSVSSEAPIAVTLGDLPPGASASVSFQVVIDTAIPEAIAEVSNQAVVSATDVAPVVSDDPETAEPSDATRTPIVRAPELSSTKTDQLSSDSNSDDVANPGDSVAYDLQIVNSGDGSAHSVVLTDAIPEHTTLVAGSATTSQGTIDGTDPLLITLGNLAPGAAATVSFEVLIDAGLPAGVDRIVNQGSITSDELAATSTTLLTDDPDVIGAEDPTVTPVVAAPELSATKADALAVDLGGDGVANAGDTLEYTLVVSNSGNAGAAAVLLEDYVPENTTLVLDSITTSQGSVLSEEPVLVDVGELAAASDATITFQVLIDEPLPLDVTELVNQALVTSTDLDDVLSDDPDTPEEVDPTVTPVVGDDTLRCVEEEFDEQLSDLWQSTFIGDADQGSVEVVDGTLRLSGNGTTLYHDDDNGHYLYRDVAGDFRVEVAVTDIPVDTGGQFRKACLMVRNGLDVRSERLMACFIPHFSGDVPALQFDYRPLVGGPGLELASTEQNVPLAVRLAFTRRGDTFVVSYSIDDGITWVEQKGGAGSVDGRVELALPETVQVGVMVASYDAAQTFTAELDDLRICHPNTGDPSDPGDPGVCDPQQPVDAIYLFDMSESMTADFADGSGNKLTAARQALQQIHDQLSVRQDGGRVALLTFSGTRDQQSNLDGAVNVLSGLTTDFVGVGSLIDGLDSGDVASLSTTPTALGLKGLREQILPLINTEHQPAVIFVTDGVPNIDSEGRGPAEYTLSEIQGLSIRDSGDFLSWGQVAWLGRFNGSIDTFDGEPMAGAMRELERLKEALPELLIYGVSIEGDGEGLGTFNNDLPAYAAYVSGGQSYSAADTDAIEAATTALLGDLLCDETGPGALGDRVWNDLDGDGVQQPGEPGLPLVSVELLDSTSSSVVATAVTSSDGDYLFEGVLPADYRVRVVTSTLPGGIDAATFDADGTASLDEATVTVTAWQVLRHIDFGYRATPADETQPPSMVECDLDDFADGVVTAPWQLAVIGNADFGGAVEVGGQLELSSNGPSMWHDDNTHFLYQPIDSTTGDFRAEVEVTGVPQNPAGQRFRKAGLMFRRDLDVRSPRIMVQYLPDEDDPQGPAIQFGYRSTAGGQGQSLSNVVQHVSLPLRLAIEKRGNFYTAWYSTDSGATWLQQTNGGAGGSVELDLGETPLVGLAAASYDTSSVLTTSFDDFAVCAPADVAAPEAPETAECDALEPLDVVAMVDLSGSMTADYDGGPSRLEAAQLSLQQLLAELTARADGSRVALITYAGTDDPASNRRSAAQVLSGLTADLDSVSAALASLSVSEIDAQATTASTLALHQLGQVLTGADPAHRPVAVWLTDELPNIDLLGRGPYSAEQAPVDVELRDTAGDYLPWSTVAWQGEFLGEFGAFEGEPVAAAMATLASLRESSPELRLYSLALQGDGTLLARFDEDLLGYAAWYTAASYFSADNTNDLLLATAELWDQMTCTVTP